MIDIIPACYAVCYVFGTVGSAWIIANLGSILLGGLNKVKEETKRLEEEMDSGDFTPDPGQIVANRPVSFRAYKVEAAFFNMPRTVKEIEKHLKSRKLRHFVERLRINGEIMDPDAVAALGAIQDSLDSTLPVMGYTVTYAVGSVAMILSGMVVTLLA